MTELNNLVILVCGGIGAGKSVVVDEFVRMGASAIEADRIGHQILRPAGAAYADVVERWPQVVDAGGEIDRAALGGIVFSDPHELAHLEVMTHPEIVRTIIEFTDAADGPVVVEVPLALALPDVWKVVFVDAPLDVRLDRVHQRGMSRGDARRRASRQPDRETWLRLADHVIVNDGDLGDLRERSTSVWQTIVDAP